MPYFIDYRNYLTLMTTAVNLGTIIASLCAASLVISLSLILVDQIWQMEDDVCS